VADFFLGVLAILAGLVFCFSGYLWLRIVLPVWGAFVGFAFGAGLVAGLGGDRFLGEVLGWVVGLAFALLFAALAYAYFAFAVVIAMTSVGFAIGAGLVVALGVDWSWVAVIVGVLVGAIMCVAYPPSKVIPVTCPVMQAKRSPRRHGSHLPQYPPFQPTPTRWPTFQFVTSGPIASMTPATSWPGTRG